MDSNYEAQLNKEAEYFISLVFRCCKVLNVIGLVSSAAMAGSTGLSVRRGTA
jgi:hypothetical protein